MNYAVEIEENLPTTELGTVDECLSLARQIHDSASSKGPLGAFFYHPNGEYLFTIFGARVSCLCYFPANYDDTGVGSWCSDANAKLAGPID